MLNATVDPNGVDTTYYFRYGTTTAYSAKSARRSAGNGGGNIGVRLAIGALAPNTPRWIDILAPITARASGVVSLEQAAIAARRGKVHSYILFTGYLPAKMRGEMQAYEVLGAP